MPKLLKLLLRRAYCEILGEVHVNPHPLPTSLYLDSLYLGTKSPPGELPADKILMQISTIRSLMIFMTQPLPGYPRDQCCDFLILVKDFTAVDLECET